MAATLAVLLVALMAMTEGQNCVVRLPNNPLTAKGLATPFTMTGCDQAADTPSFAEAAIFDPATNQVSIYHPLIINAGTKPAVSPVVPNIPNNAVVGIWFGTNGDTLTLTGAGVKTGKCVNGVGKSIFGQFAYCNAPAFFAAAGKTVTVPPLGQGADGMLCLTTRDFGLIDMDQSDNVDTTYLVTPNKQIAQNTAANRKQLAGAQVISNGSDNLLLFLVHQSLSCPQFTAPNLADPGANVAALALNEIQAARLQPQPVAIVPDNNPMVLVNGNMNKNKRDLYRVGVNQPKGAAGNSVPYCQNYRKIAPVRYAAGQALTSKSPSPDPGVGTNLFTFLCGRFEASYGADGLNCVGLLKQPSPLQVTTNADGVVTACAVKKAAKKQAGGKK